MRLLLKQSKTNTDSVNLAMKISSAMKRDVNFLTMTIANDLSKRNKTSLFKVDDDVFDNKPLKVRFKWRY